MKVGAIGIGRAGGRIADLIAYHSLWGLHKGVVPFALAVSSVESDLLALNTIDKKNRILIGQMTANGHGFGLNRKIGARAVSQGFSAIMHAVADMAMHHVDALLVIAAPGGATGSGGAPVVISRLKEVYDDPIYLLAILPAEDEGQLMAMNTIDCLREVSRTVDGILLFDNNAWKNQGLPIKNSYDIMNHELVKPLSLLLGAGEARKDKVGIQVIDASEIISTWEEFSYIGYSEMKVKTTRDRLLFFKERTSIDQLNPTTRCYTAIRNAATARLSGEADLGRARKALMIIAGPPDELSKEGFSHAKEWLESSIATSEVRGGDCPIPGWDSIAAVVMLSGYTEIPRLRIMLHQ